MNFSLIIVSLHEIPFVKSFLEEILFLDGSEVNFNNVHSLACISRISWCDLWRHLRQLHESHKPHFGNQDQHIYIVCAVDNKSVFVDLFVFPSSSVVESQKWLFFWIEHILDLSEIFFTLTVSLRMAISRDRWSFSTCRASRCAFTSGLVWLAWVFALTTSSSSWRTSIACFWG